MPELPEVQTVLDSVMARRPVAPISRVAVLWKRSIHCPAAAQFERNLIGQRIIRGSRRGKYLIFSLTNGFDLLIHLRMSGDLFVTTSDNPVGKHTRVRIALDDGSELRFDDPRKFGRFYLVSNALEITGDLGPEPIDNDFDADTVLRQIHSRAVPIKSLLLDQRVICGLGNIYAVESLWHAGIHPLVKGCRIKAAQAERLALATRKVLTEAINSRGTDLGDGVWKHGNYQTAVYGRAGEPCPHCRTPIKRIVVAQRGTEFCPRCQSRSPATKTRLCRP